jgi:NAD(P)-dependent dehydrogenase (short-subunit alcohol dehydrogenase family)
MVAARSVLPAALITGASSGIRCATALELARRGMHVLLACRGARSQTLLEAICALPGSPGATLFVLTVNCLHPGDVLTNMTARGPFIDLIRPLLPRVSADTAALAVSHLALAPELAGVSGAYFEGGRESQPLWVETCRLVHDFLPNSETTAMNTWGSS